MRTPEPLFPELSCFKVQIAERLNIYKSPGSDQILAELIQAGYNTLRSEFHKLINCIWEKNELP
jgi:hypothetical protein